MAMTKNQKNFLIFAGICGATLIVWTMYKKAKASNAVPGTSPYNPDSVPSTGGTSTTPTAADFPITMGSRGPLVKELQTHLVAQGASLPKYGIDGIFGAETMAALKKLYGITEVKDQTALDRIKSAGVKLGY